MIRLLFKPFNNCFLINVKVFVNYEVAGIVFK